MKDSPAKGNDWTELKSGTIINNLLMPVDSLMIKSSIRSIHPLDEYLDGKLFVRKDTMVVKKYMSEDIRGLYIKKDKIRTMENSFFFFKQQLFNIKI